MNTSNEKISLLLQKFYKENNLPLDGGVNDKWFTLKVLGINFTLPNFKFRRDVMHIHDIQHILNNCDITWKGEAYIAGWETANGMWKKFPVNLFSFWAFGYGSCQYPKQVYKGFISGLKYKSLLELSHDNNKILELKLSELLFLIEKKNKIFFSNLLFIICVMISQLVLFFPIIIILFLFYI